MLHVLCWNTNIFRESTGIDIRSLKIGAHRVVLMSTVMAFTARNMMRDNDALSNIEVGYSSPTFNNCPAQFMSQHNRRLGLLHYFDNIRSTKTATMYLDQ